MDSKLRQWQLDIERIWQAAAPDWREAARLAVVMARTGGDRCAAGRPRALPICAYRGGSADPGIARPRGASDHQCCMSCHPSSAGATSAEAPALEERTGCARPAARPPTVAPEIHRARKRAAKSAHPDAGGSAWHLTLSAARER
jgi:hypothetical protein